MNTKPNYISLGRLAALKWKARDLAIGTGTLRFDLLCYCKGYTKVDMYFFCN